MLDTPICETWRDTHTNKSNRKTLDTELRFSQEENQTPVDAMQLERYWNFSGVR